MKTRQIAFDSVLAAMCAVLGALALDFGNLRITFEDVPVLIGALMFGAPEGSAIGFVGTFIYQIIRYGFTATATGTRRACTEPTTSSCTPSRRPRGGAAHYARVLARSLYRSGRLGRKAK